MEKYKCTTKIIALLFSSVIFIGNVAGQNYSFSCCGNKRYIYEVRRDTFKKVDSIFALTFIKKEMISIIGNKVHYITHAGNTKGRVRYILSVARITKDGLVPISNLYSSYETGNRFTVSLKGANLHLGFKKDICDPIYSFESVYFLNETTILKFPQLISDFIKKNQIDKMDLNPLDR